MSQNSQRSEKWMKNPLGEGRLVCTKVTRVVGDGERDVSRLGLGGGGGRRRGVSGEREGLRFGGYYLKLENYVTATEAHLPSYEAYFPFVSPLSPPPSSLLSISLPWFYISSSPFHF